MSEEGKVSETATEVGDIDSVVSTLCPDFLFIVSPGRLQNTAHTPR